MNLYTAIFLLAGCRHKAPLSPAELLSGPDSSELVLYRSMEDGQRIYVEADLGDGVPRFFLVDTGAAVTTLTQEVADELGLTVTERGGWLRGVAGEASWREATIDTVQLGRFSLRNVDVAVGVPGVPAAAGAVPVAGLMGNNVWQQFDLDIDYPAGTLALHRPGLLSMPDTAQRITFDGQHLVAPVNLTVSREDEEDLQQTVIAIVDTGAGGLLLSGTSAQGLRSAATVGVEPIFGVGRGDDLPISNFLRETHRIPVSSVQLGGTTVVEDDTATWLPDSDTIGNLVGHRVLDGYRVLISYQRQQIALTASTDDPSQPDMHDRYGAWLRRRRGKDVLIERVNVMVFQEDYDGAVDTLKQHLRGTPDDAEAAIMLARLTRYLGQPDDAIDTLRALPVDQLVEHHAIVSLVNSMWLTGSPEQALSLAQQAVDTSPDSATAWLALSDARRASGDLHGARTALRQVNALDQNPDGHLLRRAWIASEEGDHYASITHIRRLIELYPSGAVAPWFYAMQVHDTDDTGLFLEDIHRARQRLHPGDGPLDFFAGAYTVIGEDDLASQLVEEGEARDCQDMTSPDSQQNCRAWYNAMVHQDLDAAIDTIRAIVEANPHRPDYLDTLAVVLEARGEIRDAREAAWKAALMDPSDVYFLWQAARLDRATGS